MNIAAVWAGQDLEVACWFAILAGSTALIAKQAWIIDSLNARFPGRGLWDYLDVFLVPILIFAGNSKDQGLDALVLKAYGWKASEDIFSKLLDLNLELAEREAAGEKEVGPWAPV
jgi:hypothetical protein